MTDAALARFINCQRVRGRSAAFGESAAMGAAGHAERRGQASPVGPLTQAALRAFRRSDTSRPGGRGQLPHLPGPATRLRCGACGRTWALSRQRTHCWQSMSAAPCAVASPCITRCSK